MGIFSRLFGKKTQVIHVESMSLELFGAHLRRLEPANRENKVMAALLKRIYAAFLDICLSIDDKIQKTREDGKLRSFDGQVDDLYLSVTIIPSSLKAVQQYFSKVTPPGYTEFMTRLLNSPQAKLGLTQGAKVLAHIVFCAARGDETIGVQLCVVPLNEKHISYCPNPIIPADLLSSEELANMR